MSSSQFWKPKNEKTNHEIIDFLNRCEEEENQPSSVVRYWERQVERLERRVGREGYLMKREKQSQVDKQQSQESHVELKNKSSLRRGN